MDIIEFSEDCQRLLNGFLADTLSMEAKYVFTPEFTLHNIEKFIEYKEKADGTRFHTTLEYKTFVEDDAEYGCIVFTHKSGLRYLSDPLFKNSRYMRRNAYMPSVFNKFRRAELEIFLIKHKNCIGMTSQEFIPLYKEHLAYLKKNFPVLYSNDNIVIYTYKRKIFENNLVKSFITTGDNLLDEARII